MIGITAVRDRDRVIFDKRSSPKWESSLLDLVSRDDISTRWYLAKIQLRKTHGIASIVPESDEAYNDCQPEAFISGSVRPYLCLHNDHRDTDVQ